ncbi:MAG: hypothetical protein LUE21_07435 [Oscillospiraceae bacterium]|nr:hypothetical protein [Oscillospiraceae bacterium]
MTRRTIAVVLLLCIVLGCMAGCGKKTTGSTSTAARTATAATAAPAAAEETAIEASTELLSRTLELSEEEQADLIVEDAAVYEEDTVVRYAQTYQGVEIYGSSIVVVNGESEFMSGSYYDLSDAFGDDFADQVAAAEEQPEWLTDVTTDDGEMTIDQSSRRTVIYITGDDTAVLAYVVDATLTAGEEVIGLELIVSPDGTTLYDCVERNGTYQWDDAVVSGSSGSVTLSTDGSVYYAYNSEYNFYGVDGLGRTVDTVYDALTNSQSGLDRRVVYLNESQVYSSGSASWSSGTSASMLTIMSQYYSVAKWFDETFGWVGLNGDGSLSAVVFSDDPKIGVAANDGAVVVFASEEVLKAPEVLAHEYGHSVFQYFAGYDPKNETDALNEAVCDVFAALYLGDVLGDNSWKLAMNNSKSKDIPGTEKTMDDYQYDRYTTVYSNVSEAKSFSEVISYVLDENFVKQYTDQSTEHSHENSYIISNTLYKVWANVLEQDNALLEEILFRSLRYLPEGCSFSQFRDAFLYSVQLSCGADTAALAANYFAKAEIDTAGSVSRLKVSAAAELPGESSGSASLSGALNLENHLTAGCTPDTDLAFLIDKTWSEISSYQWTGTYTFDSFDMTGWSAEVDYGIVAVYLSFGGEEGDGDALPNQVMIYTMAGQISGWDQVGIMGDLCNGVSAAELVSWATETAVAENISSFSQGYVEDGDTLVQQLYLATVMGQDGDSVYDIEFYFTNGMLFEVDITRDFLSNGG